MPVTQQLLTTLTAPPRLVTLLESTRSYANPPRTGSPFAGVMRFSRAGLTRRWGIGWRASHR